MKNFSAETLDEAARRSESARPNVCQVTAEDGRYVRIVMTDRKAVNETLDYERRIGNREEDGSGFDRWNDEAYLQIHRDFNRRLTGNPVWHFLTNLSIFADDSLRQNECMWDHSLGEDRPEGWGGVPVFSFSFMFRNDDERKVAVKAVERLLWKNEDLHRFYFREKHIGILIVHFSKYTEVSAVVQATEEAIALLESVNCNLDAAAAILESRRARREAPLPLLVEGLIPFGEITLLVGPAKSGKSTLLTQLAACIATAQPFLGIPVNPQRRRAVILTKEDDPNTIINRLDCLGVDETTQDINIIIMWGGDLAERLATAKVLRPDVLILDPARAFFRGDEDGSGAPSELFDLLYDFARETGAAVIVVHHMTKDSRPQSLSDVMPRGSQVFADRPRMNLAFFRRKDGRAVFGVRPLDGIPQHNLPASAGVRTEPLVLDFDPVACRFAPAAVPAGVPSADGDLDGRVLTCIREAAESGELVAKTGKNGVHKRYGSQIGRSRQQIEEAVDRLIEAGRVRKAAGGLLESVDGQ